jgi:acyl-CoA dehydrogenase
MVVDQRWRCSSGLSRFADPSASVAGSGGAGSASQRNGRDDQKLEFIESQFTAERRIAFGLTEPGHGSDATHMETRAVHERRNGRAGWRIDGEKIWITGMHHANNRAMAAEWHGWVISMAHRSSSMSRSPRSNEGLGGARLLR